MRDIEQERFNNGMRRAFPLAYAKRRIIVRRPLEPMRSNGTKLDPLFVMVIVACVAVGIAGWMA